MKIIFRIFYTATVFFIYVNSSPLHAEIYRYVDSQGQLHFTDQPPFNQRGISKIEESSGSTNSAKTTKIYRFEEVIDGQRIVHLTDKPKHSGYILIYEGIENLDSASFSSFKGFGSEKNNYSIHQKYAIYDDLIQQISNNTHVEAALLHAVIQTESAYNPYAVSPKGAVGLMQLMPGTAERYGVTDRTDVESNLQGGASYLRDLLDLFQNDVKLALAAYNAGEKTVERYGNKVPPYRETTHYVKKVMALYNLHQTHSQ